MRREERERYREAIAGEIASWEEHAPPDDEWRPLIRRTPEWFDGLVTLAADPVLDAESRRVVHRVIKYLISPLDLRPELIYSLTQDQKRKHQNED
jgi:hypothetical protein